MRQKKSIGEYLAFLTVKYEVNPEKFLRALISAEKNGKSTCDHLSISRRGETKGKIMFLILEESTVLAQFPIPQQFLSNKNNQLVDFMKTELVQRHRSKKLVTATCNSIKDLRAGMRNVNLKARILKISEPRFVPTRYGNNATVSNVLIGDDTGTIKLCLWNKQVDKVSVGDVVQIKNAKASVFRGEKQLSLGTNGTLDHADL